MGITPEAVRKRIAWVTLQSTKKRDGRWYVVLDTVSGPSSTDGDGRPVQDDQDDQDDQDNKDGFVQVLLAQL